MIFKKQQTKKPQLLFLFRHHRAAGSWASGICKQVCQHTGQNYAYLPQEFRRCYPGEQVSPENIKGFLAEKKIEFASYGNAPMELIKQLPGFRGFHVVRDPRDLLVSAYFAHRFSHTTKGFSQLIQHRKNLEKVSKDQGLIIEMEFMAGVFTRLEQWDYSLPNVLEIKFEDLTQNPYEKFSEIFKFLGILNDKITGEVLVKIIDDNSFKRLAGGRDINQENKNHHYRKGIAGDWENHFNEKHKEIFKQKYNPLLVKLGYEKRDDW